MQDSVIVFSLWVCSVDVRKKARLADFGISRRLVKDQTTWRTGSAGTKCWKAREALEEEVDVPYKSTTDVQVRFSSILNVLDFVRLKLN